MGLTINSQFLTRAHQIDSAKPTLWSKADLHLHTSYSDGYMTPVETIEIIAACADLNVVAITDHDTTEGAFIARDYAGRCHPQLDVIIGQEVTTGEGDVVGLFLQSTLPYFETAAEAIEAIHQQGGLAVGVHPFVFGWGMKSVGRAILHLPFDAVETRHGCPLHSPLNLWAGLVNYFGQGLPVLGNSDSHVPYTAGQAFTWFPGRNSADLYRAIVLNQVRPGGTTWKIIDMLRTLRFIREYRRSTHLPEPELQSIS
jgi:predicted metal-dependent phosphoesterase TrpH